MGVLTVYLDRLSNLKDTDGAMNHPDPYVKFHLEQENWGLDKNYGKQKSSVKKGTCNPTYDEVFTFEDVPSLDNLVLHVKVYDEDWGRDDAMGVKKFKFEGELTSGEERAFDVGLDKDGKGIFRKDAKIHIRVLWTE